MRSKVVKRKEWSICEEEAERIKEDVVTRRKDHDRVGYMRRTSKAASYRTNEDKRRDRTGPQRIERERRSPLSTGRKR